MTGLWQSWSRAWFHPVSARGVAALRIGLGLLLCDQLLALWPHLAGLVGPDALVSVETARAQIPVGRWTPLDGFETLGATQALVGSAIVAGVLFTLGLGARVAGLYSVVVQAWLYQRDPFFMNGGDRVLRLGVLYLCTVPCGAAWSAEAWLRHRWRPLAGPTSPLVPATATVLIRLQLLVLYTWSGIQKASTALWQQGDALYYALSSGNYARALHLWDDALAVPLVQGLLRLSTWSVLTWECGFALLVLWPRTRRLALVAGVGFHLGIFLTMSVGTFSTATPLLLLAWLHPAWVERRLGHGAPSR